MPKGTKILMVDDDKMLIDMYKERLELAGYAVEISRDGEEGLAKVHQTKPDVVLLDIMMPKVNGYEALASIKSDPATKDIPVIILSALMRDVNKAKAVESGADDYIIKSEAMPVDVIKKVEAVLKKYNKSVPAENKAAPNNSPAEEKPTQKDPADIPISQLEEQAKEVKQAPVIEIEPSAAPQEVVPPTPIPPPAPSTPLGINPPTPKANPQAIPSAAQPTSLSPAAQTVSAQERKASPVVVFLLVLIVILILASDAFFYIRYLAG